MPAASILRFLLLFLAWTAIGPVAVQAQDQASSQMITSDDVHADLSSYRAVDKFGKTLDFMLSKRRSKPAAIKFFVRAMEVNGLPRKIVIAWN